MEPARLTELARQWLADYDARSPERSFPLPSNFTVGQAYALQAEVARLREERGEAVIGYKVGCINPVTQKQLGIPGPIFGRLFASECVPSGSSISWAQYPKLGIEGELAVRLGEDWAKVPDSSNGFRGIKSIFPIIELHRARLPQTAAGLVADNGMQAGFVLPEREVPFSAHLQLIKRLDLRMSRPGDEVIEDFVLDVNPLSSLPWLAAQLAEQGLRLHPGQVVLTGSTMKLYPVHAGTRVEVEASGVGRCSAAVLE